MVMAVAPGTTQHAPVVNDEFGAGLEAELANAGAAFEQEQAAVQTGQVAANPVVEWFRNEFEGLSQDATTDTIAQSILDLQTQAEEAEQLRQQIASMQAAIATQETQRPAQPVAPVQSASPVIQTGQSAVQQQQAAIAEAARRLDAVRVSQENQQFLNPKFVKVDPETGLYEAIVHMPNVYRAVQEKNNSLIRQREILDAVTGDFYGSLDEGVPLTKAYRAQQERIEKLEQMLEERFNTVQKTIQETENDRFLFQNQDLLFVPDPANPNSIVASPAGEMYQSLVSSGKMTREEALAFVKPYAEKFAAVPVASQVQQPVTAQKPVRFTERLKRRPGASAGMKPAEATVGVDLGVSRGAWRPNWEDIAAQAREQNQN